LRTLQRWQKIAAMRRRRILGAIALLSGALALASPAAEAQKPTRAYRIGWLSPASEPSGTSGLDALRDGLRELGYEEGASFTIEARWADGRSERLPALAAELARLRVDVLCTTGSQAAVAAKQATTEIPVVFANVAFPAEQRLVASYARPGGNVTGVAFMGPEYGKRLELLREASPRLARVAFLYNPENSGSLHALEETQRWAAELGLTLEPHRLRNVSDLAPVFSELAKKRPDALMTTADPLIASLRLPIVAFAAKHRLLSIYPLQEFVDAGGLMFYGGSVPEMYRRAAVYVDRILKGAKPSELPVEQPVKFDMVISLKTAKEFGLTLPPSLLLRADRVLD
jgi:putative ABC transport system substrate-binding protein